MKKFLFALLFISNCSLFSPKESSGQIPLVKQWDMRYGGTANDFLYYDHKEIPFSQTFDGGYILAGATLSGIGGNKTQPSWGYQDYWIIKADSFGNLQWEKRFGTTGNDRPACIRQTSDKGYIIGGTTYSGIDGDKTQPSQGGYDYWIVKTDSLGNIEWDKRYGGTLDDWFFSLQQTKDGGYILGGWSESGIDGDKSQENWDITYNSTDFWIVKIDSLGNKLWDMRYGGTAWDFLYCLEQTKDGGYILGGSSNSPVSGDKSEPCWGGLTEDFWIVKTDSAGNKQWDKRFGWNAFDELYSLQQTIDGGYILGGLTESATGGDKTSQICGNNSDEDYWIVKTDSLGNKEWDNDFGGTGNEDEFGNVIQTADGGYLVCGSSYSPVSCDKTENNLGQEQTWIVKTDSLGNQEWDKTLLTTGHDENGFVIQTKDGCYAIANTSSGDVGGYKSQSNWGYLGSYDYWLVKFCPSSAFFTASDLTLCEKFCISFTDQSINNPTSWLWQFPGGVPTFSTDQNPTNICYNAAGVFDVTLITTNANGSDTLTLPDYITVYPTPPFPAITQVGYTLTSSPANTYQWQFNSVNIPGATNQSYTILQTGYYTVLVGDSNSCKNSFTVYILIDGINEVMTEANISIYPNPSVGIFMVEWLNGPDLVGIAGEVSIDVVNVIGQKGFSSIEKISSPTWRKQIDLSDAARGNLFRRDKNQE